MGLLDAFERTEGAPCRLLLPEGEEPRVQEAALRLARGASIRPILLGAAGTLDAVAAEARAAGVTVECLDPATLPDLAGFAEDYGRRRGVSTDLAARILGRRPYVAAAMLRAGAADAMLAGVAAPTRDIITACTAVIGIAAPGTFPFSFFLMDVPGRPGPLVFADCAVTENPTAEQLAEIARGVAADTCRLPGFTPRVALLSFSTLGSADHPDVAKVRAATELLRETDPTLPLVGEIQADAALNLAVARQKVPATDPGAAVAGVANILIFPDLDAGNIGYKLVRELGGAAAYGSFLHGYGRPVCDASRGATVDDLVGTARVLAVLASGSA